MFELDATSGELRKHGVKIRLSDQPFQILRELLERSGDVVTRQELRELLWSADTFVDFDLGLNSAVRKLREALDDSAENPRFVETLPRRGYRFIAPVQNGRPEPPSPPQHNPAGPGVPAQLVWIAAGDATTLAIATLLLGYERSWTKSETPESRIASLAVLPLKQNRRTRSGGGWTFVTDALTIDRYRSTDRASF